MGINNNILRMAWLERRGGEQKKREVNEEVRIDHHFANLHDEDEDRSGEKTDLATGERINNSGDSEAADMEFNEVHPDEKSGDMLGALPEEEDEAAKWLRENDLGQEKVA